MVELQSGDADMLVQWQKFIDISMSHCQGLYDRLGIDLTDADIDGESSYNDDLKHTVDHLAKQGFDGIEGANASFWTNSKAKKASRSL